jgi:UDP-glucuronate decarboxylase
MKTDDSVTGPVNIGNPNEFTIKELAQRVVSLTGSESKFIFKDLPKDDPKQRQPNITLAKSLLGWEPKIQLEEGLIKTIDYFRNKIM